MVGTLGTEFLRGEWAAEAEGEREAPKGVGLRGPRGSSQCLLSSLESSLSCLAVLRALELLEAMVTGLGGELREVEERGGGRRWLFVLKILWA